MNKIIYSIVAFMLLLTSCRSAKEYNRPAVPMDSAFRGSTHRISQTAETNNIAVIPWKTFFPDPRLQQIIATVLRQNYNMAVALNNIRLNEQYVKQAEMAFLPAITAGLTGSANRLSENSVNFQRGINHFNDYSVSSGISWEADIWGKINKQKRAELATLLQSTATMKTLQTRLISTAASSYYRLLMLRGQLKVTRQNLALSDSIIHVIRIQMQHGEATALAVQQAEVQQKSIASLIPDLELAFGIEENALSILMANQPAEISITTDDHDFTVPDGFNEGIPASLLSNRPDVKESEYALQAAYERVGAAKASMYPVLSINATGGFDSSQWSDWFKLPASLFGNIAGNLLQPVFNKRQLKTRLKVSEIEYEQRVINFKDKVLNGIREVSDALLQAEKVKEKIAINQSQNSILKSSVPNARLLFTNGMANYLEIIAVQQNLLNNELHSAELKRQRVTAYVQLYVALGGGLQ